jgi:hypothetical protein
MAALTGTHHVPPHGPQFPNSGPAPPDLQLFLLFAPVDGQHLVALEPGEAWLKS